MAATWTVKVGENDTIVIDRTGDEVVIGISKGGSVTAVPATRAQVEDLRRKLGAALSDEGELR